ncbi:MAG: acylphosphatase [Candidatus Liptonbacteria bacterium]|nr:acylphosphatase [Candidatus Liptonbacteria bacterium]
MGKNSGEMKRRVNIRIAGQVQGVFFRDSARAEAIRRGLSGVIRNEPDGTVRAEIEGEEEELKKFLAWCRKGPPDARVSKVEAEWNDTPKGARGVVIE